MTNTFEKVMMVNDTFDFTNYRSDEPSPVCFPKNEKGLADSDILDENETNKLEYILNSHRSAHKTSTSKKVPSLNFKNQKKMVSSS